MIDHTGYLKMIDLGTAKLLDKNIGYRTFTIIGKIIIKKREKKE